MDSINFIDFVFPKLAKIWDIDFIGKVKKNLCSFKIDFIGKIEKKFHALSKYVIILVLKCFLHKI